MKTSFNKDFGSFDGRTWLNCAHQGPLPNVSVESAKRALAMKIAPSLLTEDMFRKVPEGLDLEEYGLISPVEGLARSTLIVLTHKNPESNKRIYDRLKHERIDISLREGNLRISPHLYNTPDDINHILSVLSSL